MTAGGGIGMDAMGGAATTGAEDCEDAAATLGDTNMPDGIDTMEPLGVSDDAEITVVWGVAVRGVVVGAGSGTDGVATILTCFVVVADVGGLNAAAGASRTDLSRFAGGIPADGPTVDDGGLAPACNVVPEGEVIPVAGIVVVGPLARGVVPTAVCGIGISTPE